MWITHCVKLTHKCWANTNSLGFDVLRIFQSVKKTDTVGRDGIVGKDIYRVYKSDISKSVFRWDIGELAIAFNGAKHIPKIETIRILITLLIPRGICSRLQASWRMRTLVTQRFKKRDKNRECLLSSERVRNFQCCQSYDKKKGSKRGQACVICGPSLSPSRENILLPPSGLTEYWLWTVRWT